MYKINLEFFPGDIVWDDLTHELVKVKGVSFEHGEIYERKSHYCIGYFVDSYHLGGGRFPWELTKYNYKMCDYYIQKTSYGE